MLKYQNWFINPAFDNTFGNIAFYHFNDNHTDRQSETLRFTILMIITLIANLKKVQAGKDQEKVQSEKDSHSKNRGRKKPNQQSGTDTKKTFRKPNDQLFSQ